MRGGAQRWRISHAGVDKRRKTLCFERVVQSSSESSENLLFCASMLCDYLCDALHSCTKTKRVCWSANENGFLARVSETNVEKGAERRRVCGLSDQKEIRGK